MRLSRRGLLRAGLGTTAATALGGLASGCAVPTGSTGRNMVLWYWDGGLGDTVLKQAGKRFDGSVALRAVKIGGYYRSKLITTMAGRARIPDIAGLKGEDMASYLPDADQFVDLRTLGAEELRNRYLPWKWEQGRADDGRMVGFPIDCGPVAHYYQYEVFRRAGLPYEPADVSRELGSWEAFFAAGEQLRRRLPGTCLLTDITSVFEMSVNQGTKRYVDRERHFIGDQEHVRAAWDRAVEAKRRRIVSDLVSGTPDQVSAVQDGSLPSQLNASWATNDIKTGVPRTTGRWRVAACPGGPSNIGGSFLSVTKACREPEEAFRIISWVLDAANQAQGFVDAGLFPSTPASYGLKTLREPDPFFGGQITMDVFGPAAQKIPVAYDSPYDTALSQPVKDEIKNVGVLGKDPEQAWRDAMHTCRRIAEHLGVSH
ncbi:substrate-binding domain-containing protein [Streptomyces monashensis]|uniref:ABC transporter substrate-binding protein n=1 Tax=Streptomyces monashensis TaxID=1678012 RepID=UPI0033FB1E5F